MQVVRECNEIDRYRNKAAYFGATQDLLAQHRVVRRIRGFAKESFAVPLRYTVVAAGDVQPAHSPRIISKPTKNMPASTSKWLRQGPAIDPL
jgi:hypothetical protein